MINNNLYHYTNLSTAIEYILPNKELLINSIKNTNDPRENKSFGFGKITNDSTKQIEKELSDYQISERIRKKIKVICFSRDFDYKGKLIFGYNNSRMWTQYGGNHKGICIQLDKDKFLEENSGKKLSIEKVKYFNANQSNFPRFDFTELYKDNSYFDKFITENKDYLFFSKLSDWESEYEVRVFYSGVDDILEYCNISKSISAIYLGINFNDNYLPAIIKFIDRDLIWKLNFEFDRLMPKRLNN
jgi:hypothetical protein